MRHSRAGLTENRSDEWLDGVTTWGESTGAAESGRDAQFGMWQHEVFSRPGPHVVKHMRPRPLNKPERGEWGLGRGARAVADRLPQPGWRYEQQW